MGSEIEQLRNEIEVLKEDYRSLEGEVRRLRRAIAGLRAPERHPGYPESEESYSFLEGTIGRSGSFFADEKLGLSCWWISGFRCSSGCNRWTSFFVGSS